MSQRAIRWSAIGLFAFGLAALWLTRGIHDDKEALKYIGCAQDVLCGDLGDLVGNYKGYAAYVLFLVPFVAIGAPGLAVIAQAILAIAAAFALARLVERISGIEQAGTIAMVVILLCYPFQEWVLALYTESFFASIAVLLLERSTRPGRVNALSFALAGILLLSRPNGLLFVGPLLIWRSARPAWGGNWYLPAAYSAVLITALFMPVIARHQLGVIVEAHVICGFPERPGALDAFYGTTLYDAQAFLFREPGYAFGLFVRRVGSLFTLSRPYFSFGHNAMLAPLYLLYPLALYGWWRSRRGSIAGLLASIILLNAALIGLTYDEWNGRFLVPIWPMIAAFAACGASVLVERSGTRWKRSSTSP